MRIGGSISVRCTGESGSARFARAADVEGGTAGCVSAGRFPYAAADQHWRTRAGGRALAAAFARALVFLLRRQQHTLSLRRTHWAELGSRRAYCPSAAELGGNCEQSTARQAAGFPDGARREPVGYCDHRVIPARTALAPGHAPSGQPVAVGQCAAVRRSPARRVDRGAVTTLFPGYLAS